MQQFPFHRIVEVTPTVSASPNYADGDNIGGKMSFAGAIRADAAGTPRTGVIRSIVITDLAANSINIEVVFWDTDPSNTTFTDNAALTVNDADLVNIVGGVVVGSWEVFADNSFGFAHDQYIPFELSSGTTLFGAMIATGATNLASTSDLTVRVGLELD